jgi:hypothetical protein
MVAQASTYIIMMNMKLQKYGVVLFYLSPYAIIPLPKSGQQIGIWF